MTTLTPVCQDRAAVFVMVSRAVGWLSALLSRRQVDGHGEHAQHDDEQGETNRKIVERSDCSEHDASTGPYRTSGKRRRLILETWTSRQHSAW